MKSYLSVYLLPVYFFIKYAVFGLSTECSINGSKNLYYKVKLRDQHQYDRAYMQTKNLEITKSKWEKHSQCSDVNKAVNCFVGTLFDYNYIFQLQVVLQKGNTLSNVTILNDHIETGFQCYENHKIHMLTSKFISHHVLKVSWKINQWDYEMYTDTIKAQLLSEGKTIQNILIPDKGTNLYTYTFKMLESCKQYEVCVLMTFSYRDSEKRKECKQVKTDGCKHPITSQTPTVIIVILTAVILLIFLILCCNIIWKHYKTYNNQNQNDKSIVRPMINRHLLLENQTQSNNKVHDYDKITDI